MKSGSGSGSGSSPAPAPDVFEEDPEAIREPTHPLSPLRRVGTAPPATSASMLAKTPMREPRSSGGPHHGLERKESVGSIRGSPLHLSAANLKFSSIGRAYGRARRLSSGGGSSGNGGSGGNAEGHRREAKPSASPSTRLGSSAHSQLERGHGLAADARPDADDLPIDVGGRGGAGAGGRGGVGGVGGEDSAGRPQIDGDSSWASDNEAEPGRLKSGSGPFDSSPGLGVFSVGSVYHDPAQERRSGATFGLFDKLVADAMPPDVSAATAAAARKLPASALRRQGSFGSSRPRRSVSFADRSDSSGDYESRHDDSRLYGGGSGLRPVRGDGIPLSPGEGVGVGGKEAAGADAGVSRSSLLTFPLPGVPSVAEELAGGRRGGRL